MAERKLKLKPSNIKSMVFKMEDEIPIPAKLNAKKPKYPLKEMRVGSSFTVPLSHRQLIASILYQFSMHNTEYKFITKKEKDKIRIWRVERFDGQKNAEKLLRESLNILEEHQKSRTKFGKYRNDDELILMNQIKKYFDPEFEN